jgi:hypothetical protein
MKKPDWFLLIEQWRIMKMGERGITLPFLVGALAYKAGKSEVTAGDVKNVLDTIREEPVAGYVIEVAWCNNIKSPVFSVGTLKDKNRMQFMSSFMGLDTNECFGFGSNLEISFGCKDASQCYQKLLDYAAEHVEHGHYSRARDNSTGEYQYRSFSSKDITYIVSTIGNT